VQRVLELLHFIGVADDLNLALLAWLEDTVPLDDLPDALLLLREGSVLGRNLGLVADRESLGIVLERLHVAVVQLLFVSLHDGTCGCGKHCHHERDVVALNLDVERDAHCAEDLGPE